MDILARLREDRTQAFNAKDPGAGLCYFATASVDGNPELRTLVLRDVDEAFAVFINASSPKWQQLQHNGNVALVVYLGSIGVQYRLWATVTPIEKPLVDESWQLRPDTPKQLDWYYESVRPQSSALPAGEDLAIEAQRAVPEGPLIAPPGAQGLALVPTKIERLDLNSEGGPHQRELFELADRGEWTKIDLVP